jgi:hypothetical protein
MTEYGKGGIIGVATALPATSAAGFMLADKVHPLIAAGFLVVNAVMFIMLVAHISRYLQNRNAA